VQQLGRLLTALETDVYYPLKRISGGFANACILGWTKKMVYIELTFGIQDGTEVGSIETHALFVDRAKELPKYSLVAQN